MQIRPILFSGAVTLLAWLAVPGVARADIAPPDSCTGAAGVACNNAGPSANQPGVCTTQTCSKVDPNGQPIEYDCVMCVAPGSGGSGGSTQTGGGGSAATGTATGTATATATSTDTGSPAKSSGCSVGGAVSDGTLALTMLALGGLAFAAKRRR